MSKIKIKIPPGWKGWNPIPIDNTFIPKPNIIQPKLIDKPKPDGFEPGTVITGGRVIKVKTYNDPPPFQITDPRKIDPITGVPVKDNNRFNVKADGQVIKDIVLSARKHGVDPYTAVAMALQETGLTSYLDNDGNPLHVLGSNKAWGKTDADTVDNSIKMLKAKLSYAALLGKKTEAEQIQAWNGYGKIGQNTEGKQSSFYGIDVTKAPLDLNVNPVYGKRVIDLRDNLIKKNPSIVQLIESTK